MAWKRTEPSLTKFLASWPRQRQEARGGTSAPRALDPSAYTLLCPADTLGSFNYRLQNRRRRKKNQRNDTEKRLSFTFLPALEACPLVTSVIVYRCEVGQCYAKTHRVCSSQAILCADPLAVSSRTTIHFPPWKALIAPSYHLFQLQQ